MDVNKKEAKRMNEEIGSPTISSLIMSLRNGEHLYGAKINKIVDEIFLALERVKGYGEDDRKELWLKARRGNIEEYGDYEDYKHEGIVKNKAEFKKMWDEEYPDKEYWFNFVSFSAKDGYRAIFLGRNLIYQSRIFKESYPLEGEIFESFFNWIKDAVLLSIKRLEEGTYNDDVAANLDVYERTGIISRKDYYEALPEEKEGYLSEIKEEEISKFLAYIAEQKDDEPVGRYLPSMTANDFYLYCSLGYKANEYDRIKGLLTPKEQYYAMADGREYDLKDIDGDSPEAFEKWYNDKDNRGGHPYEVCAGGNSTHIDLYVMKSEKGYYLALGGKSWGRSIETVKFYNALRDNGVAVRLIEAEGIKNRLLGNDYIGIVPQHVIPRYCESYFPDMEILDFMNLPYEEEYASKMLEKIKWLPEDKQFLL